MQTPVTAGYTLAAFLLHWRGEGHLAGRDASALRVGRGMSPDDNRRASSVWRREEPGSPVAAMASWGPSEELRRGR